MKSIWAVTFSRNYSEDYYVLFACKTQKQAEDCIKEYEEFMKLIPDYEVDLQWPFGLALPKADWLGNPGYFSILELKIVSVEDRGILINKG